jgi:hypothetical protein
MIERLEDDNRVKQAAIIGYTFKQDPVAMMECDTFTWCTRVAAANFVIEEKNKEYRPKHRG